MSTYNNALTLNKCILSVLTQSLQNFRFIIIDDASTDETTDILASYSSDNRIDVVRFPSKRGLCANLKLGMEMATSPFIARIDSDDYWTSPDKLKQQIKILSSDDSIGIVGTWAVIVGSKNGYIRPPSGDSHIRKQILIRNCFIHSSVVFRRTAALSAGGYRAMYSKAEDYDLWLRIGQSFRFENIPECLTTYTTGDGITANSHHQMLIDSYKLCVSNRSFYPNFQFARLKWLLQLGISEIKTKMFH